MKKLCTLLILLLSVISLNCFAAPGASTPSPANTPEPYPGQVWIAFMPVIFFTIILSFTIFKLHRDDVTLADLLAEKNTDNQLVPDQSNPPQRSTSRLIALLSGLTTLAIGASLCTFYIYEKFVNVNSSIDFSNLTTVLVTLGIGVVPYGFNQASAALKK